MGYQARIQDFLKGGGGGDGHKGGWGVIGVIAPVGEKLLFGHTKFSATRGGGDPTLPPPPPVSATGYGPPGFNAPPHISCSELLPSAGKHRRLLIT